MVLSLLLACGAPQHRTENVGAMNAVWLEVATGDVQVTGGLGGGTLRWDTEGHASFGHTMEPNKLKIDGHCPFWFGCKTNLKVEIPRNIPVTAIVGTGDVRLIDLDEGLQIQTDEGNVTGTGLNSPKVRVQTNWGSVKLVFKGKPERIDVDVVVGDIEVEVPSGLYAVREDATEPDDYPEGIPVHLHTTSGTAKLIKRAPPSE